MKATVEQKKMSMEFGQLNKKNGKTMNANNRKKIEEIKQFRSLISTL